MDKNTLEQLAQKINIRTDLDDEQKKILFRETAKKLAGQTTQTQVQPVQETRPASDFGRTPIPVGDTRSLTQKLIDKGSEIFLDPLKVGINRASQETTALGQAREGARTALRIGGEAGEFVGDVAGNIIKGGVKAVQAITPEPIESGVKAVGVNILQSEIGQAGLNAINQGVQAYDEWRKTNPDGAQALEDAVNISVLLPTIKPLKQLFTEGGAIAKNVAKESLVALSENQKLSRLNKIAELAEGAKKLTTEVLQVPMKELKQVSLSDTLRGIKEASKVIKKAKTFGEIEGQFKTVADDAIGKVNQIIAKKGDEIVDNSYLKPLINEIKRLEKDATKVNIANKYKEILKGEVENLDSAGGAYKLFEAQEKKIQLNKDLKKFFNKKDPTDLEAADTQARNLLREGLMLEIERVGGKEVGELNRIYAGLSDAQTWLRAVGARYMRDVSPTGLQKIMEKIPIIRGFLQGRPDMVIGTRSAGLLDVLPTKTSQIEQMIKEISKLENKKGLFEKIADYIKPKNKEALKLTRPTKVANQTMIESPYVTNPSIKRGLPKREEELTKYQKLARGMKYED